MLSQKVEGNIFVWRSYFQPQIVKEGSEMLHPQMRPVLKTGGFGEPDSVCESLWVADVCYVTQL